MECILSSNDKYDLKKLYSSIRCAPSSPNIAPMKLEEDEEYTYESPSNEEELSDWWNSFSQRYKYPLYCMVLATEADDAVASLIKIHREELSIIARDKCCFIYFRDLEKAKLLKPFCFSDHAKGVIKFIQLVDIQPDSLPCLLFFESIIGNEYVLVPLDGNTISNIIANIREVFTYIYSRSEVSLATVKTFKLSKQVRSASKTVGKGITTFSKEAFVELVKSLIQVS